MFTASRQTRRPTQVLILTAKSKTKMKKASAYFVLSFFIFVPFSLSSPFFSIYVFISFPFIFSFLLSRILRLISFALSFHLFRHSLFISVFHCSCFFFLSLPLPFWLVFLWCCALSLSLSLSFFVCLFHGLLHALEPTS